MFVNELKSQEATNAIDNISTLSMEVGVTEFWAALLRYVVTVHKNRGGDIGVTMKDLNNFYKDYMKVTYGTKSN